MFSINDKLGFARDITHTIDSYLETNPCGIRNYDNENRKLLFVYMCIFVSKEIDGRNSIPISVIYFSGRMGFDLM